MMVRNFFDIHKGETALLVGNGPNLSATPPEWFDYPSFGMNTIYKYEGWTPTYFVAVDKWTFISSSKAVNEKYVGIPKFLPVPTLEEWKDKDAYYFPKISGDIKLPKREDVFKTGLRFHNVMHAAMQLAWHMGFTTLLLIGVQQKQGLGELKKHFWGTLAEAGDGQTDAHWNLGYFVLSHALQIKILNISQDTYVPETILERADWRDYANAKPS